MNKNSMVKLLLPSITFAFALTNTIAQTPCSARNIYGLWKEAGRVRSYSGDQPPVGINVDSLRGDLNRYISNDVTWRFNADGTFLYELHAMGYKDKGHFSIDENRCTINLRSRGKQYIVYIDDTCILLWHDNSKFAWFTEYHR